MIELWKMLGAPHKWRFGLALGLSALAGMFSVVLLGLSGWFLTASAIAGVSGAGYVFNHLYPSAGVRFAAFGRVLTRYSEQLIGHDATLGFSAKLRPELFAAAASSARGFAPMKADELSALIDDVDAVEAGFLKVMTPAAALIASLLIAIGFALAADVLSGVIVLLIAITALPLISITLVRGMNAKAEKERMLASDARQFLSRTIENAIELDIFGRLKTETGASFTALNQWSETRLKLGRIFRLFAALVRAVGLILASFILWRALSGSADLALGVGAALAVMAAFDAMAISVSLITAYNKSSVSASRLIERLDRYDPAWNPSLEHAIEVKSVFPVSAKNLSIRAADDAEEILIGSFELRPRQITQIIGQSGAGKSTLAETLMRLHPQVSGEIHYNGIASEKVRIANALQHIAFAPQFPAFLPGSLREQFSLARPDLEEDLIWNALEIACADSFLTKFELPLDIRFGENDFPFSGGQLRRLSIARAILADPQILVLDEPFAGLDMKLVKELSSNLASWCKERERSLVLLTHEEYEFSEAGVEACSIYL